MKALPVRLRHLAAVLVLSCPLLFAQTAPSSQAGAPATDGTQEVVVPALKTPSQAGPPITMSASLKREIVPGRKVTIVTQDQPLLRQTCKVEQFDAEKIVCRGKSGPSTYSEKDLVTVSLVCPSRSRFSPRWD